MFFKRRLMEKLEHWHEDRDHIAFVIEGISGVGKTTLVREFGKRHYGDGFVEISFKEDPDAKKIFSRGVRAKDVEPLITAYFKRPLEPGKTLVFMDDIQECPHALVSLKFLPREGKYDYILAGRCVKCVETMSENYCFGLYWHEILYPMDFEEFLDNVMPLPQWHTDELKSAYRNGTPVRDWTIPSLNERLGTYLAVGGMPDAVQTYLDTGDFGRVMEVQKGILERMKEDVSAYCGDSGDRDIAAKLFSGIASQLDKEDRMYDCRAVTGLDYDGVETALWWLEKSGMLLMSDCIAREEGEFQGYMYESRFRLYLPDPGLTCEMLSEETGENVHYHILTGNYGVCHGAVPESALAMQMFLHESPLHFYARPRHGAADFIVHHFSEPAIAVSISGDTEYKASAKQKAMDELLSVCRDVEKAQFFCTGNVETAGKVTYYPLFMLLFYEDMDMECERKWKEMAKNGLDPLDLDSIRFTDEEIKAMEEELAASADSGTHDSHTDEAGEG